MAYRAIFDSKRGFGIELEGFGLSRLEVVEALEEQKILCCICDTYSENRTIWTVGTDATISQLYPVEIVSPVLRGEAGLREIQKVCEILQKAGLRTDESCGLHIHWNVSDYTGHSALNILKLYAKYEKILDLFFEPQRRGDDNQHCRSLIKQGEIDWIHDLNRPFYYRAFQIAQEFEAAVPLKPATSFPSARHHKVNLCAINKYGTVEFRQHHGTLNFEEIKNWIIFSQQLIQRAKDTLVGEGVATWDSLIKTLALTDVQLHQSMPTPDKKLLRECREFYKKKYRENRNEPVRKLQLSGRW